MAAATSVQLRFLTDAAHLMRQAAPQTSAHLMRRRIDLASSAQAGAAAAAAASAGPSMSIAALPQTDVQRQHVCTSCGLILIPGSDGTTLTIQSGRQAPKSKNKNNNKDKNKNNELELERKRKRDDDKTETGLSEPAKTPHVHAPHAGITKVYMCGICRRETRIALPPPPPLSKQRKHKAVPAAVTKAEDATSTPATVQTTTTTTTKSQAAPTSTTAAPPATAKAASNANSKKRAKNRKAGLLALLDKSRGSESSSLGSLNLSFDDFRKK